MTTSTTSPAAIRSFERRVRPNETFPMIDLRALPLNLVRAWVTFPTGIGWHYVLYLDFDNNSCFALGWR